MNITYIAKTVERVLFFVILVSKAHRASAPFRATVKRKWKEKRNGKGKRVVVGSTRDGS